MSPTDLHYFQLLKQAVQTEYLRHHSPTQEEISQWKGVDIMYFLEDLRIRTRGNISEKTFYTYFKAKDGRTKLPRIDTLNMFCLYVGYKSWSHFKKAHEDKLPIPSIVEPEEKPAEKEEMQVLEDTPPTPLIMEVVEEVTDRSFIVKEQEILPAPSVPLPEPVQNSTPKNRSYKLWILGILGGLLLLGGAGYSIWEYVLKTEYTYCFIDADRNTRIPNNLSIQVIKENESPIHYSLKAGECFSYETHSEKRITMKVSSPYYETTEIVRNLEAAPTNETIILKPNNNAIMLHYYSHSIRDLKKKREQLNHLISDNALIYQVFDNDYYGVETLTKQKYINLMTLPSSSLAGLSVIDTQLKNGKLVMIKFRINDEEKK